MANAPQAGLVPPAKKDKSFVNYRQYQSCSSCDHFWSANNLCDLVAGNIGDNMVCDLWELRSQSPQAKDKAFYESEFNKVALNRAKMGA